MSDSIPSLTQLPARLQSARERVGLTQCQVASRTGIGESSLSDFENGKREPSVSQIAALAAAFHRHWTYFLDATAGPTDPLVLWRARPAGAATEIEARFLELCRRYRRLEFLCGVEAASQVPQFVRSGPKFTYWHAAGLARDVRLQLELGSHPTLSLQRILEEVWKVRIFHLDIPDGGSAASTWGEDIGPGIVLNSGSVRWRRNFDLAHELFHLMTWKIFRESPAASAVEASPTEEKLAQCFASTLLMPEDSFRNACDVRRGASGLTFEALFDLAREFDVSVDAAVWRIHMLDGRGPDESEATRALIDSAKALAPQLGQRSSDRPPMLPARFESLARRALRAGQLSIGTCAEYLGITRQQAGKFYVEDWVDEEKVPLTPS